MEISEGEDGAAMAAAAGLRYGFDDVPGIARRRRGLGFSFHTPDGSAVPEADRERIDRLAIPPAWTEVWISVDPDNHLQATGRDDRGRKQYRYHDRWREIRDIAKFDQLGRFGARIDRVRRTVAADLASTRDGLEQRRVVAAVTRLIDQSLIRIGSEQYAADNETFGATTLEPGHVTDRGDTIELCYVGKGDIERLVVVTDEAIQDVIRRCLALRPPQLFCFERSGTHVDLTAAHVNEYLAAATGGVATAKSFRTWGGTVVATAFLAVADPASKPDRCRIDATDAAAEALGNTRAVCRAAYVAPAVLAAEPGDVAKAWRASRQGRWRTRAESATLRLLALPTTGAEADTAAAEDASVSAS